MKKQKTAVELLNNNFSNLLDMFFNNEIPKKDFLTMKEIYYQQTKDVFEEQIIEAYKQGQIFEGRKQEVWIQCEKYYEETFLTE